MRKIMNVGMKLSFIKKDRKSSVSCGQLTIAKMGVNGNSWFEEYNERV